MLHDIIRPRFGRRSASGFSLVELMVALAILSILFLVMASLISLTSQTYLKTTVKAGEFRAAQAGFESLTRRLAQATLNPYLDYEDVTNATDTAYTNGNGGGFVPTHYGRQSELRFIAGNIPAAGNVGFTGGFDTGLGPNANPARPTQAIFFAAPLSIGGDAGLNRLLNLCGYYIEYNADPDVPSILDNLAKRYRFRLMEMIQSTPNFSLYADEAAAGGTPYVGHGWFSAPLNATASTSGSDSGIAEPLCSSVLAENVVALIVLPRLAPDDEAKYSTDPDKAPATLAPQYFYDSTSLGQADPSSGGGYTSSTDANGFNEAGGVNSKNQLPPLVQVTMVAIDEPSAIRLQAQYVATGSETTSPGFIQNLYFSGGTPLFQDATKYASDLIAFQNNLSALKLTYHVFQTNVSIKEAKWSSLQTGS